MAEWTEWYEDEHGNGWRYTEDDEGNWEEETWGPDMDNGGASGCMTTLAPGSPGIADAVNSRSRSYMRVAWHHDDPTEPVVIYIELDDHRYEVRKVEQYADGRLDRADAGHYTGTTFLSEAPVSATDRDRRRHRVHPRRTCAGGFRAHLASRRSSVSNTSLLPVWL